MPLRGIAIISIDLSRFITLRGKDPGVLIEVDPAGMRKATEGENEGTVELW